jgi:hypothetical protein
MHNHSIGDGGSSGCLHCPDVGGGLQRPAAVIEQWNGFR